MKKHLTASLILLLLFALFCSMIACSITVGNNTDPTIANEEGSTELKSSAKPIQKEVGDNLIYTQKRDGTYELSSATSFRGIALEIPSVYNGEPVTSIGSAFFEMTYLVSLTIPSSIQEIKGNAFTTCENLVEICNKSNLPIIAGSKAYGRVAEYALGVITDDSESKLTIDDDGFICYKENDSVILIDYKGTDLILNIPADVTEIRNFAFDLDNEPIRVTIPASVKTMQEEAFQMCPRLIEVINLSSLPIEAGSESYGRVALYASHVCTTESESRISVQNDFVLYTDEDTVSLRGYCGKDHTLTIPAGVTEVGKYAFDNIDDLTGVTIPNSVTAIGECAFYYSDLTEIIIPDSITTIGESAFRSCRDLTSISIGSGVQAIGSEAFLWIDDLTEITFRGNKAQWDAIQKGTNWLYWNGVDITIHCTDEDIIFTHPMIPKSSE